MKNLCLLGMLLCAAFTTSAQKQISADAHPTKVHEPVNPQKDKMQFGGYTIRLVPLVENTYGYEITKGKELIALQMVNPFTQSGYGLEKKEDAYNLAKWQITQLDQESKHRVNGNNRNRDLPTGVRMNQPIPRHIATQLNIQIKSLK